MVTIWHGPFNPKMIKINKMTLAVLKAFIATVKAFKAVKKAATGVDCVIMALSHSLRLRGNLNN